MLTKKQKERHQAILGKELEYAKDSYVKKEKSEELHIPHRKKDFPGEDTIMNRMIHWKYTSEQLEVVKKAIAAKVPM